MSERQEAKDLDDELLGRMRQDFFEEAPDHLDQLNLNLIQLEGDPEEETVVDEVFRIVHTLKGSSSFVGLDEISQVSRKMEDVFGNVRKGSFKINAAVMESMYAALDVLTTLTEKAQANEKADVDISGVIQQLEALPGDAPEGSEEESEWKEIVPEDDRGDTGEALHIYRESYDQLAALKHIVYSSVHLSDPESLAVLFSKQIDERMSALGNAVWLADDRGQVVEVARNGSPVKEGEARVFAIEAYETLKRVIREQLVVWSSSCPEAKELLPEFQAPTLFPVKAQPEALGFLVVDPEELAEVEVYQFIGQFAAMMLNISKLHQKVDEQRAELNEMTEILLRQNAQLASLYHANLELMKEADPVALCRIVVEAVVSGLEAQRAAAFLIDDRSQEFVGASGSEGFEGIEYMRFPMNQQEVFRKCVETGRVVTYVDHPEELELGPNVLKNWVLFSFKGRERSQGVLVVDVEDVDASDPISILVNHASIMLDNLILRKKLESAGEGP